MFVTQVLMGVEFFRSISDECTRVRVRKGMAAKKNFEPMVRALAHTLRCSNVGE